MLKKLSAEAVGAVTWNDPRGVKTSVHHELAPGCFLHIDLGAGALVVRHGQSGIVIPIEQLVTLAQTHDPSLIPKELKAPAAL